MSNELRARLAQLIPLNPADARSRPVVGDQNFVKRVFKRPEGSVNGERLVIQSLSDSSPRETAIRRRNLAQPPLHHQMRLHHFSQRRVLLGQGERQRRVENMPDTRTHSGVESRQLHLDTVMTDMARVRDEEEHVHAAERRLELSGRRLVGRLAERDARLCVGGGDLGRVAADENDLVVGRLGEEVRVGAAAQATRCREYADGLHCRGVCLMLVECFEGPMTTALQMRVLYTRCSASSKRSLDYSLIIISS